MLRLMGGGKGLHLVNEGGGLLLGIGAQGVEALPVFRHPHRHHGDAVDSRGHARQIQQGAVQGGAVVDPGTGDDLAVHGDAGLGEAAHDGDALPGPAVFQHFTAQLRVGGVDGHVDGGDAQGDDPLHLPLGQIC